ncbi:MULTISPECIES: helix-turn-helix domain-containing protein [Streptomyces]|uniref:Helix-turn-helix domain-containing protein n=1 Tax=Streptomyces flavochromogenes TaxID=68199 RepID=A0ABW6Y3M2_9ACTN
MSSDVLDRKTRAAVLLARGMPSERVGRDVGVTGRTVRRWLDDPAFAERVQEIRHATLAETVRSLETVARHSVAVLGKVIADDDAPRAVRVRAALGVLAALPNIAAHAELEERLSALEAAEACRNGGQP